MQKSFDVLVREAADMATTEARELGRQGRSETMELYYGRLQPDYPMIVVLTALPLAGGHFVPTGRSLSAATPYSQYARWITDNSRDLPLFA